MGFRSDNGEGGEDWNCGSRHSVVRGPQKHRVTLLTQESVHSSRPVNCAKLALSVTVIPAYRGGSLPQEADSIGTKADSSIRLL